MVMACADGGDPGKGNGSRTSGSKANKQLRELQRLMAWAWDSRVEEHPPGAKAMHDFENVLNFQLDASRRRRGTAASVSAGKDGSAASTPGVDIGSTARHARRGGSVERGTKRASPAPFGSAEASKAGRKPGKAARVETSPAPPAAANRGAGAAAAAEQQQQQPSPVAPSSAVARANTAADSAAVAAPSPPHGAGAEAAALDATPAARQQPQQRESPPSGALAAACPAAAEFTPAVQLGGVAHTPSTLATVQPSRPSTGGAVALADAHFLPTPAPTPLPLADVLYQPSGEAPAPAAASEPQFRAPAPRSLMTSLKDSAKAGAAPSAPAASAAAAPAGAASSPADSGGAEAAMALDLLAAGPAGGSASEGPSAGAACGSKRAVPAIFVGAAAAVVGNDTNSSSAASPMEVDAADPPVVTPVAAAAAAPAAVSAEVPTPAEARALAAAEQLEFHQPRPVTCPPLFKQAPGGPAARKAPAKSPLGSKRSSPANPRLDKENAGLNSSGSSRLTPRTAEPVPPPQAALSAWKQQQMASLSAGFHSRQRRLLELLSACNRVAHASPSASPTAAAVAGAAVPSTGCGSGNKAAKAAGTKPPLGPRAAAVAAASCWAAAARGSSGEGLEARACMGHTTGRLKEQHAA